MVQYPDTDILTVAEEYIREFFRKNIPAEFVFHNLQHTVNVVEASKELGEAAQIEEQDMERLLLAAWFHDLGYDQGSDNHEARSCEYATAFLEEHQYPEGEINLICDCIMATRYPQQPKTQLHSILCDADLSHLGKAELLGSLW